MTSAVTAWLLDARYSLRALLARPAITAVAAGLIGVAALASYVPARRARGVNPAESLAGE